jgi:DNA topoisomerase-2
LIDKKEIKSYISNSTETEIDIQICFYPTVLASMTPESIIKLLKLSSIISTNNMHLFDIDNKLTKYDNVYEIIEKYFISELDNYTNRIQSICKVLASKMELLRAKTKFIKLIKTKKITIINKSNEELYEMFHSNNMIKIDDSFDFYMKLPLSSLTLEKIIQLEKELQQITEEYNTMSCIKPSQFWYNDLIVLQQELYNAHAHAQLEQKKESAINKKIVSKKRKIT